MKRDLPHGFTEQQIAEAISPRIQELIMLPTEKCNFRCTYCYEDFELGKMSAATQRAIELFIEKRADGLDALRFSWFGGEPLVASDVVLRISRFAKTLCDERKIKFIGGLTTNAYVLTQELAIELIKNHQDFFQITFDGWGEMHDALRKRADGRGTFHVIWNNLLGLKALNLKFEVCVRIHVRRENIENLETFVYEFANSFNGDQRFYLDFQHLRDMGGSGGQTVENPVSLAELRLLETRLRASYAKCIRKLRGDLQFDARQMIAPVITKAANAGESAGSQRASEQVVGAPYICYATRPNSILIRSNGRIGKCTVAFSDERNDLGYLADDGSIVIDNEKLAPWIRGLGSLEVEDVGCPIQRMPRVEPRATQNGTLAGISVVVK